MALKPFLQMTADRPYILFDNSVQWFAALARVAHAPDSIGSTVPVFRDIPANLWDAPFLRNLTSREETYANLTVNGAGWTAWALSEQEFGRLMRILDLQPAVTEHAKLIALS